MKHTELERAWPAPKSPPGFTDRVLERLQQSPALPAAAPRRASWPGWLMLRGLRGPRGLAMAAVALALVGVLSYSLSRPVGDDVFAAEPRVVAIGERVVAELSGGAHVRWSGDEVWQSRGEVTYRVEPGSHFVVQTPHGSAAALGTVFRVVVADGDVATGDSMSSMKKQWAVAGAGVALGALLFVSVDQGSVRLETKKNALLLGAGQAGSVGADGVPLLVTGAPGAQASAGTGTPSARAERPHSAPLMTEKMRERRQRVLDTIQGTAKASAASAARAPGAPSSSATDTPAPMKDKTGMMGAEVKALNAQFLPLVDQCFDQAKERGVRQRGMLALNMKLAGAEGVGRIIESLEPAENNPIDDPELIDCLRQSAFTVDLPEPTATSVDEGQLTIPFDSFTDAGAPATQ